MPQTELFIADIFKSIQGEGKKLGTPSLFLRLGICNLQCAWCDTPYTWKKGQTDYKSMSIPNIIKRLGKLKKHTAVNNIVITGGEPLLQQKQLAELLSSPLFKTMEIECETNGSMQLIPAFKKILETRNISFNISPKLADSGNKTYTINFYPNSVLKFVYTSKKSEKPIGNFMKKYSSPMGNIPVFIMAEGTTKTAMEEKYKDMLSYCLKQGFRITPRLQIYLFGNTRGT